MIKKKDNKGKNNLKTRHDLSFSQSQVEITYPTKINKIADYIESKIYLKSICR